MWGKAVKARQYSDSERVHFIRGWQSVKKNKSILKWHTILTVGMWRVSTFLWWDKWWLCRSEKTCERKASEDNEVGLSCWYILVYLLQMRNRLHKNFSSCPVMKEKKSEYLILIGGIFNKPWKWCLIPPYTLLVSSSKSTQISSHSSVLEIQCIM